MKLVIANLSPETSCETIESLFSYYGAVTSVELLKDKRGRSIGEALVEMTKVEELEKAIQQLNGLQLDGNIVLVERE